MQNLVIIAQGVNLYQNYKQDQIRIFNVNGLIDESVQVIQSIKKNLKLEFEQFLTNVDIIKLQPIDEIVNLALQKENLYQVIKQDPQIFYRLGFNDNIFNLNDRMNDISIIFHNYAAFCFKVNQLEQQFQEILIHLTNEITQQIIKHVKVKHQMLYKKISSSVQLCHEKYIKAWNLMITQNHQNSQDCKLLDLSIILQNILQMTAQEFQAYALEKLGYRLNNPMMQKYQLKLENYCYNEVFRIFQIYRELSPQQLTHIQDSLKSNITKTFTLKQLAIFTNFNAIITLLHIIATIEWKCQQFKSVCYLVSELQNYTKFNSVEEYQQVHDVCQLFKLTSIEKQPEQQYEQLVQFRLANQQNFQQYQEKWNFIVQEEENINIIYNLYLLIAGVRFNNNVLTFNRYDPSHRNVLIKLVRYMSDGYYNYANIQIIKCLDNLFADIHQVILHQISYSNEPCQIVLQNSIIAEVDFLTLNDSVIQKRNYFNGHQFMHLIQIPPTVTDSLIDIQKEFLQKQIQYIHENFLQDVDPPHKLYFEQISPYGYSSNVITICISGYTSMDENKIDKWKSLVSNNGSQIISLHWDSSTVSELVAFIAIHGAAAAAVGSWTALLALVAKVYPQNPFNTAFKEAERVGKYLAYLIAQQRIFGNCQINLIGFSLGTELIVQSLCKFEQICRNDSQCLINDILLMGGVADVNQINLLKLDFVAGTLYNVYSKKDQILSILFKLAKLSAKPCGLYSIDQHFNQRSNFNFTSMIDGHTYYKALIGQIVKLIDFDHDMRHFLQ